ncbi:hypothetical protein BpHYR1_016196 [Brachionus plicatilis]|uniref:Uncharacterized protein n=1 Tax=Brachionus plicatilis TaxID=10195 RepID=A0A3M7SE14_BRAPC|nr:hypothetical protein BpHYR1_016196 [Brachionus plicatilis]
MSGKSIAEKIKFKLFSILELNSNSIFYKKLKSPQKNLFYSIQLDLSFSLMNDQEMKFSIGSFMSKNLYTLGLSNAIDLPYIRILLQF